MMERGGSSLHRFEDALSTAKAAIKEACSIYDDMKAELSERSDGYASRDSHMRDDWGERRGRDSMGRYR